MKKEKSRNIMTDYEKQRLDNLKQNACRMKAAGFDTLANKILVSMCNGAANKIVADQVVLEDNDLEDISNEDREYSPNQEEVLEEEYNVADAPLRRKASKNENIATRNGERQPLQQTLPMAEFAMERKRKRLAQVQSPYGKIDQNQAQVQSSQQDKNSQQALRQQHQKTQNLPSQVSSQPHAPRQQHQNPKNLIWHVSSLSQAPRVENQNAQHIVASKKMVQEQSHKQKKVLRNQVCSPGSLDVYKKMRQRQRERNVGHLPSVGLSQIEGLFNSIPHDQVVQCSPIKSTSNHDVPECDVNSSPRVLVNNQSEMQSDCHIDNHDGTERVISVAEEKKHRGPTLMAKVHNRTFEERQVVIFDENGEPIGPSNEVVNEFSNFLGTLAKDPELAPLNILDWKYMPTKDDIWSYVQERYIIPEEVRGYVLKSINALWVVYKSRVKTNHYTAYTTYEDRWNKRPSTIPDYQFKDLLDYWDSPVSKEIASKNSSNRKKHEDVHTLGRVSLARLRHELTQKSTNKEPPSDSMVYQQSRKRDPTRVYKTSGCKSKENIEKINKVQLEIDTGHKSSNVDPLGEVIGKKRRGRGFLQGRGAMSGSKGKEKKRGYILDQEFFQNMKAEWTAEVTANLASTILAQLQVANPHMNLVIPTDFTTTTANSNQFIGEVGIHPPTQSGDEDVNVEAMDAN